jgi:hypothetical protein
LAATYASRARRSFDNQSKRRTPTLFREHCSQKQSTRTIPHIRRYRCVSESLGLASELGVILKRSIYLGPYEGGGAPDSCAPRSGALPLNTSFIPRMKTPASIALLPGTKVSAGAGPLKQDGDRSFVVQ